MKIFVTGASGYIGSAVSAGLARAGHEVLGLVRTEERGKALAKREVTPVVGDMEDPASYHDALAGCQAVVHCAAEYSKRYFELDWKTVDTVLTAFRAAGLPRLFVYTSGCWVYGDTGGALVDEATVLTPPDFVAPRVEHEGKILAANGHGLRTLVIRPGCVYGGRGGLTAPWFQGAVEESAARMVGEGSFRWTMVHVDDLADAYVRAVESPWGGEVFNVSDRSRFTVRECATAASRAAGAAGAVTSVPVAKAVEAMGPSAQALAFDQHVDARKAVRLLGWQPRHGGFVDGAGRYFRSWRALQPHG